MAIKAASTGAGTPFAKFASLGDKFVGAWGGNKQRQQRDFNSGDPKVKPDGKAALEEVNWFIAMPATTAGIGKLDDGLTVIELGSTFCYSFSSHKWWQVIDARKQLAPVPAAELLVGEQASGDVYEMTLCGFSAATDNPQGAARAGFTVVDGRIKMTTEADHERYVIGQAKKGQNANPARDFTVVVRRPTAAEAAWEALADALYLSKPWLKVTDTDGALRDAPATDAAPAEEEEAF